jgi:hypothetical protein
VHGRTHQNENLLQPGPIPPASQTEGVAGQRLLRQSINAPFCHIGNHHVVLSQACESCSTLLPHQDMQAVLVNNNNILKIKN